MRRLTIGTLVVAGAFAAQLVYAHTAICSCFDNGDHTITCEGGFSDGSTASGVSMKVFDGHDKLLVDGKMAADGTFKFKKPDVEYHVIFDAGQSHIVTIDGSDITE